jgi:signal transduction histidine kinase
LIDAEAALLGSEIHDELMPLLFASSANVHRLLREIGSETSEEHLMRLRDVAQWLDQAMESGRQMIGGVFPPDFSARTWNSCAEQRLACVNSRSSEIIHWSIDEDATSVSPEIAFAAFRITVEACRNAIGHGRAEQIEVKANCNHNSLTLTIQDDGVGFDPDKVDDGHFGLRAMKQRAKHVGGELSIDSIIDHGTKIVFCIP